MGKVTFGWAMLAGTAMTAPALAQTQIDYWMWDANQAPLYQQCAAAFTAKNPDITVAIRQDG